MPIKDYSITPSRICYFFNDRMLSEFQIHMNVLKLRHLLINIELTPNIKLCRLTINLIDISFSHRYRTFAKRAEAKTELRIHYL